MRETGTMVGPTKRGRSRECGRQTEESVAGASFVPSAVEQVSNEA